MSNVKTIRVIVKKPGDVGEVREIQNDLWTLQGIVGGYIEVVPLKNGVYAIVNEEGKQRGMKPNIPYGNDALVGTVVLAGIDGDEFTDVPRFMQNLFKEGEGHGEK